MIENLQQQVAEQLSFLDPSIGNKFLVLVGPTTYLISDLKQGLPSLTSAQIKQVWINMADGEAIGLTIVSGDKIESVNIGIHAKYLNKVIKWVDNNYDYSFFEIPSIFCGFLFIPDQMKAVLVYSFDGPPAEYSLMDQDEFVSFVSEKFAKRKIASDTSN